MNSSLKWFFKPLINKIVFLTLLIANCINAQELTLQDAYSLMLSKNGNLNASQQEVNSKKEEQKAMKGLKYPSLSISGMYAHLENDIGFDLNEERTMVSGLLGLPDPSLLGDWNFTVLDQNLGFATADISWPIFAGGKINAANKASKIKLELSENEHRIKENALTIKLIDYYFKLKLAIEAKNLRKKIYETIEIHSKHATKLFENGIIPEVETLNAKVALSNAKRELQAAKKDVSLATTAIKNLIGGKNFNSASTKFIVPSIQVSLQEFQQKMIQENEQLKFLEKNQELAKIGVKVENSEYFPKVALFGKHSLWKDNLSLVDINWVVGVGATWNIFNGFEREHKIKAAKHKVIRVQQLEKQAKLNLNTYTEKLYNQLEKQYEQYNSLATDEELAEKLKYMRTRAFEEGTGTSLEVIDATLKMTQIKLFKIKALYHYNSTYGELMVSLNQTENFFNKI
ncbi:Outer membrane protein TolC [Lutibacter oricola]|uniref:Outer membrane protein TolC n=1 Tax=Lutibacter oricola TaxID=762486 RepID=A0A1H3GLD6_9FLAO|nr:TolC family protein [Lutibacter oricola]SDY03458.1 Outer membrane protein TolC [Lutibacter oricola]